MGELDTILQLVNKLQAVEELIKRVENLEKKVEELTKATIENNVKNITSSLNNPNATTEEKLVTAAELTLESFVQNIPMKYKSDEVKIKRALAERRSHE